MNKVKIIEGNSAESLEREVNNWLATNLGARVIYIKYIYKFQGAVDPYSCMIIYGVMI